MNKKLVFSIVIAVSTIMNLSAQRFENLALTPPMGWNSWNKFACNINEKTIKETADALVSKGLRDAGYIYINIDDCWQGPRDSLGFITADSTKFPSGIKALADYVHSKGLKLGIYSCAGNKTCGGYPGSRGHEYQDAYTYAKWGVDYLKYDWCYTNNLNAKGAYETMRNALYAQGRPIVFSICEWGDNQPWEWGAQMGNLWRTTGDIYNCFDCIKDYGNWKSWGVMQILDKQKGLRKYAGPGHWNDPDMLEVGNGMSPNQERAHFSMWCMLAAPLILGNDIRNMNEATKNTLENKEVIAIDQDSLGIEGLKIKKDGPIEVWFKPLMNNQWAVCFLNRDTIPHIYNVDWQNYNFTDDVSNKSTHFDTSIYNVRNLWSHKNEGNTKKSREISIPAQDIVMYRLFIKK